MTALTRRSFLGGAVAGTGLLVTGGFADLLTAAAGAAPIGSGYGQLVADPAGVLDLPAGFEYRILTGPGTPLADGSAVPWAHDGMAAFRGAHGRVRLVRNHELSPDDIVEDGATPVPQVDPALVYDPDAPGGTTTLVVSGRNELLDQRVSLAGTDNNCAGGPTPWATWLTCEETDETLSKTHGWVFEVDPFRGGDPEPLTALGRFPHEAVAIDPRRGVVFLTEDEDAPNGLLYRLLPHRPLGGRGSLHAGGTLQAMTLPNALADLSEIDVPGTVLTGVGWVGVPDPSATTAPTRTQDYGSANVVRVRKGEGVWWALHSFWFVSSFGDDSAAKVHDGQIWRYRPHRESLELVAQLDATDPFDGPDNITISPYGFALCCEDGDDDQHLVGVLGDGSVFALARNAFSDTEFAGACFSPDRRTLFVNTQGDATTFAIRGPWRSCGGPALA